jgi:hypothetical protein
MSKPTPWKDEYTLLCEKCGYVVEGLDTAGPCPECGKPISESLPFERPGLPWQSKTSIWTITKTWYRVLHHPKNSFDEMRCIEQDGMALTAAGLACSVIAVYILLIVVLTTTTGGGGTNALGFLLVVGIVYWVLGFIYAWIAAFRLRVMTRNRYRIDHDASWAIAGHSSIGLCIPPIIVFMSISLVGSVFLIELVTGLNFDSLYTFLAVVIYILLFASIPIGLVVFEVLCTIGVRRCKFRNRIRPPSVLHEPTQTDTRTT